MNTSLVPLLQRTRGWRLGAAMAAGTVAVALVIVSLMDLLFHGEVTADFLVTGFVAAGFVAPPSLALLNHLLHERFRREQEFFALDKRRVEHRLAMEIVQGCRELGVTCALDDFGTGYSSLTALNRLPIAEIKIDQSFVRDMLQDRDDMTIVAGALGLARTFDREVVAEGVESIAHGAALLRLDCELAQGFGIAAPMPAAAIAAWVKDWAGNRAWRAIAARALPPGDD